MARLPLGSRIAVAVYVVALAAGIALLVARLDPETVLYGLQRMFNPPRAASADDAASLLADIQRYRKEVDTMEAGAAADAWLALHDRAADLGEVPFDGKQPVFDADVNNVVGLQSVLAALPGPAAWPVLRERAAARSGKSSGEGRAHALRMLTELLAGDQSAATVSLAAFEDAAKAYPAPRRGALLAQAAYLRAEIARLYGTPAEVADSFAGSLAAQAKRAYGGVDVPDLVGLVGEAKAAAILREALAQPARLRIAEGNRTRALARRIALEEIDRLEVPQWGLVDGLEAAELYEALARRFTGAAKVDLDRGYDPNKSDADAYYFIHLVVKGRHADAEKALRALTGDNVLYLPRGVIDALQRAGYNAALYAFLHDLLARRPELRAWEVYTRQAAYTANSAKALALVEGLLERKDLPGHVLTDLRFHRVGALLAADRIELAVADLRQLLAPPAQADERTLEARNEAALRLAGLGRVLGRAELSAAGFSFARAVLALPADQRQHWSRERRLKALLGELRKQGRAAEALAMAQEELKRVPDGDAETARFSSMFGSSSQRTALIELAALHGAAQRHGEVQALMREAAGWGAGDLSALLAEKDSLGVPLGLIAARALAAAGDADSAIRIARALVESLPGYDPAFEQLVDSDKEALGFLKTVYARDRFEERPLIWMAIVLHRQGRSLEAEALIRQAIVIDPSDGEEGPSDRMRAYAVLAQILEVKGEKGAAGGFRKAVQAIRISERSDELHKLGLYERAFAGYREALGYFSDAYCVQSRLAVRLYEQGRRTEALEHYRRAYELMPASFGRVESHCFGCESVFQGPEQQKVAEQVFTGLLKKEPEKPQLHYLLGYLEKERGLHGEALKRFRAAVALDPEYLNAWKHLHEIGASVYVMPAERDEARMKMLELDPRQRHVRYDLAGVADLGRLWRALESANATAKPAAAQDLYPLPASAAAQARASADLPPEARAQMERVNAMMREEGRGERVLRTPRQALARHNLVRTAGQLLGAPDGEE